MIAVSGLQKTVSATNLHVLSTSLTCAEPVTLPLAKYPAVSWQSLVGTPLYTTVPTADWLCGQTPCGLCSSTDTSGATFRHHNEADWSMALLQLVLPRQDVWTQFDTLAYGVMESCVCHTALRPVRPFLVSVDRQAHIYLCIHLKIIVGIFSLEMSHCQQNLPQTRFISPLLSDSYSNWKHKLRNVR